MIERYQENEDIKELKILVVGVGGAGNNCVTTLQKAGIKGATTIAVNTDASHLSISQADIKILIGKQVTHSLGAGGYPAIGEECAQLARDVFEKYLKHAHLVFLTAGLGGGTGTGASPIIAEIAKKEGAIVIGMMSTPFEWERARKRIAIEGIEKLRKRVDSLIVLDNNRLLDYVPHDSIERAFGAMDNLIGSVIKGITETITQTSLINLDYADFKTIMTNSGLSVMLYGEGNDPESVVKNALSHPLLDVEYKNATGALIHVSGGKSLSLKDTNKIAADLTSNLHKDANVILGARITDGSDGRIKLMAIITGVRSDNIFGMNVGVASNGGIIKGLRW